MILKICLLIIDFYQKWLSFDSGALRILSPGGACKYTLRCSEYTKLMMAERGVLLGAWFGLRRIISCR